MVECGCSIQHSLMLHLEVTLRLHIGRKITLYVRILNLISEICNALVASIGHFLVIRKNEIDCVVHLRLGL